MDIAGVVLSLPGVITSCADLYKLTVTAKNFSHDVNIVICLVEVEQMRFAYWLQDVGFIEGSGPTVKFPPAVVYALAHLLRGMEETLKLLGDLIDKYEFPDNGEGQGQNLKLPDQFWNLRTGSGAQPDSRTRVVLKKLGRSTVKPLTWAAAEQERADKLLSDLSKLNDGLNFVSEHLSGASASMLPLRALSHVIDDGNMQKFIEATRQHYPELARCADFRREVIEATTAALEKSKGNGAITPSPLRLLSQRVSKHPKTDLCRLVLANYEDKSTGKTHPVLLEDKSYAHDKSSQYEKFVEIRVGELAAILSKTPKPAEMHVLDCVGYIQDRKDYTFSFLFRFPGGTASNVAPVSLQKLLPIGANNWSLRAGAGKGLSPLMDKPSLRTRFSMALSLSRSLSLLQACGVLHKGISPANIVFFQPEGQAQRNEKQGLGYDLTRPFISGFTWARLHGAQYISDQTPSKDFSSTSGLLQVHPGYSFNDKQRYVKLFDVYSLGLVLLQIGLWQSLQDIADEVFPSQKFRINAVGFGIEEASNKGTGLSLEGDPWLQDKLTTWRKELVARQRVVPQSDGIASVEKPRESFWDALIRSTETLLLPVVGEIYMRVVARCLTGDVASTGIPRKAVAVVYDENQPEYILQDAIVKNIVKELAKCVV